MADAKSSQTLPLASNTEAVLLRDDSGRILLVEPVYKNYWELPVLGRLLVADWVPPHTGRTEGVMFVYDGRLLDAARTDEIHLPADELRSWAWSTPAEAQSAVTRGDQRGGDPGVGTSRLWSTPSSIDPLLGGCGRPAPANPALNCHGSLATRGDWCWLVTAHQTRTARTDGFEA
jgi:8-oxo-dGTP diphosphatase